MCVCAGGDLWGGGGGGGARGGKAHPKFWSHPF